MSSPIKLNLKIYQGSTFKQVLRWESSTKVYIPITNISKSAPVVITTGAHSVPLGWRARVTNVTGMKEINNIDYQTVTSKTATTVTFNQINSLGYSTYTSGGILEYNEPVDITNFTARMQIREKLTSEEVLYELTTENNGILLDSVNNTITIYIPDETTSALNFNQAVYSLELDKYGEVYPFLVGSVTLQREVTR